MSFKVQVLMPIYEYKCVGCGRVKEMILSANLDLPKITCGDCDSSMVRVISAPADPHFKGPGFYATDYKGKK